MTIQEFISKYNGQPIDFDGAYGNQCVDLMNQYCVDVLGIQSPISELPGATAYEIFKNYNGSKFTKTFNTPAGVPQAGDIVFWDTTIGEAGHVDVFENGDTNNFTGFDQNWPVGSVCHDQVHDYNGVVGWLHPISQPTQNVQVDSATFQTLVTKSTAYDAFVAGGYKSIDDVNSKISTLNSTIDSLNSTINDKNTTISSLNGQVSTLQTQVTNLETSLSQTQEIAKKVPDMQKQLDQATSDRDTCLYGQEQRNRQIAQLQTQLKVCQTTKVPSGIVNRLLFLLGK